ncbi:MAG: T9SS type A sorting domain-containing protein [Saprospiraceae bacterium]
MLKTNLTLCIFILFTNYIFAQAFPEPCDFQVEISNAICFDPPGCVVFKANPVGGTQPFTYEWSNGVTSKNNVYFNPNNSYMGTCEVVTVTDSKGCVAINGKIWDNIVDPVYLLIPDTIYPGGTPTNFDVSINDISQVNNYEISQPPSFGTITFNNNGQGIYTPDADACGPDYFRYFVFDNSCNYSDLVTVDIFNGPCAKIFLNSNDCNNACTGSAFFYNQEVLTPPLTYNWSNGGTDASVDNLCMGTTELTVTDALGASDVYQIEVENASLDVSIIAVDESCQTTKIHLTPSYSQSPEGELDFKWSGNNVYSYIQFDTTLFANPGHPDSIDNIFQLIINSSNGCSDTAFHNVNVLESPRIIEIKLEKMFCALDTIELHAAVEKGTPPYTYQWLGPQGIQSVEPDLKFPNATSAHSGQYKLFLADINGCSVGKTKYVNVPDSLSFQLFLFPPNETLCQGSNLKLDYGINSGSYTVPDKIEWSGPNGYSSTEQYPIVENLQTNMAGFYSVKVTFGEDCYLVDSMEIFVSPDPAAVTDLQITPPTECNGDDGQIEVSLSFPPPYSVYNTWNYQNETYNTNPFIFDEADVGDFRHLEISTPNCVLMIPVDVPYPAAPIINTTDVTCLGNDGTAAVATPNAPQVSARFYLPDAAWNDYVEGLFVADLIPATYEVFIKDSITNCNYIEYVTINPHLDFEVMVVDTPNCDDANGSLEITATGQATPPINFNWSNNVSGNINSGLETGWYSVTMTDGDGCERHENIFLPPNDPCNSLISGHTYFNYDCECTADGDEIPFTNVRVCAENGTFKDCTYTNNNGEFWLFAPLEGDYTLTTTQHNDYISEACPPQTVTILNSPNNASGVDLFFCGDTITDLRVDAYCAIARPGFTQQYNFQVSHVGTSFTDTMVSLTVDLDDNLDIFQITPSPSSQDLATNQITWTNHHIAFNSELDFKIRATVYAQLGDTLVTTAQIVSNNIDADLNNNSTMCEQIVIGSFDPNDKLVTPLGSGVDGDILATDTMLNYTIRFQNTGTDTAFTVVVRDTLDPNVFDLNSVQPRMASHPFHLDVEGENILVFRFENINLPDSNRTVEGSKGFVTFDINIKPDLPIGTNIQNSAAIYFDYNEPIITPEVNNTIDAHSYKIEGTVRTEYGDEVSNVNVLLGGNITSAFTTNSSGVFLFEDLTPNESFNLNFEKNTNPWNGVTTQDIVFIRKHILGLEILDSPYKLLAADVNNSGQITALDMVIIRSLILLNFTEFPNNDSWKIIDGDFVFADPTQPWASNIPQQIIINNLETNRELNMIGIKMGDVNNSAQPWNLLSSETRGSEGTVSFDIDNQLMVEGNEYLIAFQAKDFDELVAYQFTLDFDKDKLSYVGFEKGVLDGMEEKNLGMSFLKEGKITFAWSSEKGKNAKNNEPLFFLKFNAKQKGSLSEMLQINSSKTQAVAYNEEENIFDVNLTFIEKGEESILQVFPNPFHNNAFAKINLPEEVQNAQLELFTLDGKLIKTILPPTSLLKGEIIIPIDTDKLPSGIYFIHLKTERGNIMEKLVKIK